MTSILGAVFARGGSKGVPRKNVRRIGDKSLTFRAVECALASEFIDRVIISSDDQEIMDEAVAAGAEAPFVRPAELAKDDSVEWHAWRHLLDWLEKHEGSIPDILVCVPTTSPLRTTEDIDACVQALLDDPEADAALTVMPARRHPDYNMAVITSDGSIRLAGTGDRPTRRQDATPMFDLTTVAYATRTELIRFAENIFEGRVVASIVPVERGLDIDDEIDMAFAEFMLQQREKA